MRTARLFTISHSIPCILEGGLPPPHGDPSFVGRPGESAQHSPRMQIPMDADPFSPDADPLPPVADPLDADPTRCRPHSTLDADPQMQIPRMQTPPRSCACAFILGKF